MADKKQEIASENVVDGIMTSESLIARLRDSSTACHDVAIGIQNYDVKGDSPEDSITYALNTMGFLARELSAVTSALAELLEISDEYTSNNPVPIKTSVFILFKNIYTINKMLNDLDSRMVRYTWLVRDMKDEVYKLSETVNSHRSGFALIGGDKVYENDIPGYQFTAEAPQPIKEDDEENTWIPF